MFEEEEKKAGELTLCPICYGVYYSYGGEGATPVGGVEKRINIE